MKWKWARHVIISCRVAKKKIPRLEYVQKRCHVTLWVDQDQLDGFAECLGCISINCRNYCAPMNLARLNEWWRDADDDEGLLPIYECHLRALLFAGISPRDLVAVNFPRNDGVRGRAGPRLIVWWCLFDWLPGEDDTAVTEEKQTKHYISQCLIMCQI